MKNEKGFALIETLVALVLLGVTGAAFLHGLTTSSQVSTIANDEVAAMSLAQAQIEWVRQAEYVYEATEYTAASLPSGDAYTGYSAQIVANPVNSPDDGIQEVTITIKRWDEGVFQADIYKVDK